MRVLKLLRLIAHGRDGAAGILLSAIVLIVLWLSAMLLTTAVPKMALERFHLQTGSFVGWSLQQVVPPMYNFENEFEFEPDRTVSDDVLKFIRINKQINHFPTRVVTFFDGRYQLFNEGNGAKVKLTSRYGRNQLVTTWQVTASDTGLELKLLEKRFDRNYAP